MSPYHMELLIFLRCNIDLWDARTVETCMKRRGNAGDRDDDSDNEVAMDGLIFYCLCYAKCCSL